MMVVKKPTILSFHFRVSGPEKEQQYKEGGNWHEMVKAEDIAEELEE